MSFVSPGKVAHATVGRIALVMALGAASGGLTSTIVSGLIQVVNNLIAILYITE